ncbi:MAG: hypothetical protein ACFFDM_01355 [Candidatus Thorarchaeota archaeon]
MEPDPKLVVFFGEFDAPKTNIEPYLKLMSESSKAFTAWTKKGIIKDFHSWTDNTGHFIVFFLFESIEKFAKLWNEPEFHNFLGESSLFLENMRIRLMRPAFAPE